MKQWMLYSKRADFNKISAHFLISPYTARIMVNRDIREEEMEIFLRPDIKSVPSPYLLNGAGEAAKVLKAKIESDKRIRIVGDYDIDGVCSTYIYYSALKRLGAKVDYEIPDRIKDGYGINEAIIEAAYRDKIDTVLTCDNGIAATLNVKTNAAGLVGEEVRVLEAVDANGGRVRLQGEVWSATCSEPLGVGAKARVVRIDGATAVIEPLFL